METETYIDGVPPEIIYHIFSYLPVKMLMKCRAVSVRWKEIIEEMTQGDSFWKKHCAKDFENVYKIARGKCRPGMNWADLYQSLSLWSKLRNAMEDRDEFCFAASVNEEIKNITVLPNSVVSVLKQNGVIFYDIETYKPTQRIPITGNFLKYSENDNYVVMLNFHYHLYILEKSPDGRLKTALTVLDVKGFILVDNGVYHIDLLNNVYFAKFNEDNIQSEYMCCSTEGVMAVGSTDNRFHLLSFQRNIFTLVDKELVLSAKLEHDSNLMHVLHQYNLLGMLDLRIYFQWMFLLNQSVPEDPLQDTILTRAYGDVVFVGSNWGVLRIYYKPYKLGQLDIYHSKPVKQYNFMERSDCPVLSTCPILNVDVYEKNKGHVILVAMPKKIAVLSYSHNRREPQIDALLAETEAFNIISIDEFDSSPYAGAFQDKGTP